MTSLAELNADTMTQSVFIGHLGAIFEHSPWIAEKTWAQRPFVSIETLHTAMVAVMREAGYERQLALIRAHPELAGKAAEQGVLTRESTTEQASAGLNQFAPEELDEIRGLNKAYQEKFGFPFIMAVKGCNKAQILLAFRRRLDNTTEEEFAQALKQIEKIALLRLRDLLGDS